MPSVANTVAEFLSFMQSVGGRAPSWYVGISDDAERRLFEEHGVNRQSRTWIYEQMNNNQDARAVESQMLQNMLQGGKGGGDNSSRFVYVYQITSSTRQ
jgi:hypothetical protein